MIKLFISDVDGVLTDGTMYYTENGDEIKKFSTYDGMGFEILRNKQIKTCLITSENTKIVSMRAAKMKIDYLYQGKAFASKLEVAKELCLKLNITFNEVAYIGDDLNCIDLLKSVAYRACPSNARKEVKSIDNIHILKTKGGDGAVREWIEILLGL
jgi:YrbI family 3-deoxy-D-manno-octulosonate 8-phosphate phosphatase